mmetsp:Transcript_16409/g.43376  ORF Transcript_16409/g.43376 Transcript_16409/m.43376 type:complete len:320 (+) Transcript_16409:521-1480(+)
MPGPPSSLAASFSAGFSLKMCRFCLPPSVPPFASVQRSSRNLAVWKWPCCMATCRGRRSRASRPSMSAFCFSIMSQSCVLPFSAATCKGVCRSMELRAQSLSWFASEKWGSSWNTGRWPTSAARWRKVLPLSASNFSSLVSMNFTYLCGQASASISSICAHHGFRSSSASGGSSLALNWGSVISLAAKKFWKPLTRKRSSSLPPSRDVRRNMAWPCSTATSISCQPWRMVFGRFVRSNSPASISRRFCFCIAIAIFSRTCLHCFTFSSLLCRSACCLLCTRCSMTSMATRYTAVSVTVSASVSFPSFPLLACLSWLGCR